MSVILILSRIFGPKRDEVTGELRRLHNEELYDLYCSSNVIRVTKSRRVRLVGRVAHEGREEVHTQFWWGNLRGRDHFENLGVNGEIILKLIFKIQDWAWTTFVWYKIGNNGGLL
jgi:hypothetical protein